MRQILLLTYTFPPDNTPAAVRPKQLCDYLPAHGYQPIVVASSFDGACDELEFVRRVPVGGEPLGVVLASKLAGSFMRLCAPYNDRLPWAPFAASAAAQLIRSRKIEAVVSTSPFLVSHLAAFWLKRKFDLPWVADFQDPVIDNPMRDRRWLYPYDALVEGAIFRAADKLTANTDTVASAWRRRYPRLASKVSVLWNSFDPAEKLPTCVVANRSYRVLSHIGALYGQRHPGQILAALDRLGLDASEIRVKLVGPIQSSILADHRELMERLRQRGVLEFDGQLVDRKTAMFETAQADYLLLLDINAKNASFQVPSKLLDYVRCGKPILAYTPKGSPVEHILVGSGVSHTTIDPTEPCSSSDQKILEFFGRPYEQRSASSWFNESLSARTLVRTLADLLNELTLDEVKPR